VVRQPANVRATEGGNITGITLEQLEKASTAFFNFGASFAAVWALYQYRVRRRTEAARWMQEMFRRFYVEEKFSEGRALLEYDFEQELSPILKLRVADRDISLSQIEREKLAHADKVLNYFEHLLYLEEVGNIRRSDRLVFFEYWFDLLSGPDRAVLRRYLNGCGYERLAASSGTQAVGYVALTPAAVQLPVITEMRNAGILTPKSDEPMGVTLGQHELVFETSADNDAFALFEVNERMDLKRVDVALGQRIDMRACRRCLQIPSGKDVWVHVKN
jgi:hypothetical protein